MKDTFQIPFPNCFRTGLFWFFSCLFSAFVSSLIALGLVRFFLRQLFSFQGWMYLERHQIKNPPWYWLLWFNIVQGLLLSENYRTPIKDWETAALQLSGCSTNAAAALGQRHIGKVGIVPPD
jgi:hypothetical protein